MRLHLRGVVLPGEGVRDLWVHDGLISFDPVRDAETLCGTGWIVPGLVDAHCHVGLRYGGGDEDRAGAIAQVVGPAWAPVGSLGGTSVTSDTPQGGHSSDQAIRVGVPTPDPPRGQVIFKTPDDRSRTYPESHVAGRNVILPADLGSAMTITDVPAGPGPCC